jgi:hypothetical protein
MITWELIKKKGFDAFIEETFYGFKSSLVFEGWDTFS